jgi:hypothetical protein
MAPDTRCIEAKPLHQSVGMGKPVIVRAVLPAAHRVDGKGGKIRQQVEQRCLRLIEAPSPQVVGIVGQTVAPALALGCHRRVGKTVIGGLHVAGEVFAACPDVKARLPCLHRSARGRGHSRETRQ